MPLIHDERYLGADGSITNKFSAIREANQSFERL